MMARREIYQKIYTTEFLDQKFCTLKMRKPGLILPTIKQRKFQYLLHIVSGKIYTVGNILTVVTNFKPDDGASFSFHKSKQPQPCSKKEVVGSVNEAHDKHGGAMPNKIFSCFVFVRTKCQRIDHVLSTR